MAKSPKTTAPESVNLNEVSQAVAESEAAKDAEKVVAKRDDNTGLVTFASVNEEHVSFPIQVAGVVIRPSRSENGRLVWRVPAQHAERFAVHHHVKMGRVVRVEV